MPTIYMRIIESIKTNLESGDDPSESRRALARVAAGVNAFLTLWRKPPTYVDGKLIAVRHTSSVTIRRK